MISHSQRTQASAATSHVAEVRSEQAQPQKRAHMAALFKGKTVFAHARMQRLATRKALAHKLAQKLGMRKPGMAKTARFTHSAKAAARGGRTAAKGPATKKSEPRKAGRDQKDGERGSNKERQDRRQEEQNQHDQQHDQQQKRQQHSEEQARRKANGRAERDARAVGLKKATVPAWLTHAIGVPDGPEREQAIAKACCDALLSLRQQLSTPATPANGARLYRHLQQMQDVRSALGPLASAGLDAIRQRLIDGAARRPAGEIEALAAAAGTSSSAPADTALRDRLRNFNLLAGLMLLSGERPVTGHSGERAASIVRSLAAAREALPGEVAET